MNSNGTAAAASRGACGPGTGPAPRAAASSKPIRHGELVVEVLLAAAHPADDTARRSARTGSAHASRSSPMTTGTVGTTSKPSIVLPGLGRGPRAIVVQRLRRVLGRVEDRQPAVGDLAGQLEVLRPDGGEVDRDVLAHRVHGELAAPCPARRAAAACSARPRSVTSCGRSARLTMSTYSRVRPSGLSNRTPCQPSDTCGPDTPRPSRNRPPDSGRASLRSSRSWPVSEPGSA